MTQVNKMFIFHLKFIIIHLWYESETNVKLQIGDLLINQLILSKRKSIFVL